MRNITKILLGIFCVGILLGGIGVGVAFVEYSSLEYLGEETLGSGALETETVSFNVSSDPEKKVELRFRFLCRIPEEVVYDSSLPENTVVCEVTYNNELWELYSGRRSEKKTDYCYVTTVWMGDDFRLAMEKKDEILNDLKNRKYRSYSWDNELTVKIKAHPSLEGRLEIRYAYD